MNNSILRKVLITGLAVLILFTSGAHRGSAAWQGEIGIGVTVEVATGGERLNLRQGPGLSYSVVAQLSDGVRMTVVGGPRRADNYVWWELEGPSGRGWAVENFLRVVIGENTPTPGGAAPRCEKTEQAYPGVVYCLRDGGETHVISIKLDDPHVRFETVLAEDVQSVNTNERELIREMAARYQGTAAAITADYSGSGHGPEGLTIKNGVRLDGIANGDGDFNAVNRSSLVISMALLDGGSVPIAADITRLKDDRQEIELNRFFNAAGGGPQVMFEGAWEWSRGLPNPRNTGCRSLNLSDIINGECFVDTGDWHAPGKRWTAIGITQDNHLIWVVTPYRLIRDTLQAFQVREAIKMDGGGSSQLWYAGREVVNSSDNPDRRLASGLLVFYLQSAQVAEKSMWPVAVENESVTVRLAVQNTGAETWAKDHYALVNEKNPWGAASPMLLPRDILPGDTVTFEWQTEPFSRWGIFTTQWRMTKDGQPFPGDPASISVVVIPEELEQKRKELEAQIREWIAQGIEDIEAMIREWIQKEMQSCLSSFTLPGAALIVAGWSLGKRMRRR